MKEFSIPEKWAVRCTKGIKDVLNIFMHQNKDNYSTYKDNWEVTEGVYFHYPSTDSSRNAHSNSDSVNSGYQLLTKEQFLKYIIKQQEPQYLIFN